MIPNKDFKFRDDLFDPLKNTINDTVPIEILLERFKGVVYNYNVVRISEEEDGGAKLKFTFTVLTQPETVPGDLQTDAIFIQTIGMILNSLILDSVGLGEDENGGDDIREINLEESDQE